MDFVSVDAINAIGSIDAIGASVAAETLVPSVLPPAPGKPKALTATLNASKDEIRTSLKASTLDGIFASVFSNMTGGVLLTNFSWKWAQTQPKLVFWHPFPCCLT
ncbi:MAG: hypothetical protein HC781_13550 [Leptolyngbyaceae cyanobacterium CSU_1_4]|nr:hypothetical protein [Leptolyngbyaceae cyanobacterium CSU_1_4]